MTARFEARKDAVHSYYGVFDTVAGTWHLGTYDDAVYAAGVPSWRKQARAVEVAASLNGAHPIFVVENLVEHDIYEVVGVRFTLDAAKALGEAAYGSTDGWGVQRPWLIDWRESTDSTLLDPDTSLRTWSGHRPGAPATARSTFLFVSITEHLVPQESA